jgi:hypothetical protein
MPYADPEERKSYHRKYMRTYAVEKRQRGLCRQYGCENEATGEYCAAHVDRKKALDVLARDECYAAYGGKCQCCGESNPMFLTIDHVNNDGKTLRADTSHPLGGIGGVLYRKLKRAGYPKSFALLCYNCNCGRFRNGGICPHQSRERHQADGAGQATVRNVRRAHPRKDDARMERGNSA